MAYNTTSTAKDYTGQAVTTAQLDWGRKIIDMYSQYRWESTERTDTFSGDGESSWLELRSPIVSVSSFTIDDVSQTEDTDFEIRKVEGMIRCYSGLPWGHDNIVITYNYGFTSGDALYDYLTVVKQAEASLALLLKKNPLMLPAISIEGISVKFDQDQIQKIISSVPKMPSFVAAGRPTLLAPREETIIE